MHKCFIHATSVDSSIIKTNFFQILSNTSKISRAITLQIKAVHFVRYSFMVSLMGMFVTGMYAFIRSVKYRLAIFSKCKTGTHIADYQHDATNILYYISEITESLYVSVL